MSCCRTNLCAFNLGATSACAYYSDFPGLMYTGLMLRSPRRRADDMAAEFGQAVQEANVLGNSRVRVIEAVLLRRSGPRADKLTFADRAERWVTCDSALIAGEGRKAAKVGARSAPPADAKTRRRVESQPMSG